MLQLSDYIAFNIFRSIRQEAFETDKEKCSIFMQCFKKAIKEPKNLGDLYEAILEGKI